MDLCLVIFSPILPDCKYNRPTQNSLVFEWWSENWTEKSLFMVLNVRYWNDLPSHVTLSFEYWTPTLSGIKMDPVLRCLVFRWLLYSAMNRVIQLWNKQDE